MIIYLLLCLLLFSGVHLNVAQDSIITFTPSEPLCIGEEVVMMCFVVPPISETFISATALISFNGSTPAIPTTINGNTLVGIDTTRYTADITGLNISTDRPGVRLNISDYQATDGDIVFGCHGINSTLVPSVAIITGSPQRLASPPSSPNVTLSDPNNNCTNILISWDTPDSDRDIIEYSVYRNNTFLITTTDNDYTDTNQLTINTVYEYSVTAISCAGDSTPGVNTVSIRDPVIITPATLTVFPTITMDSRIYASIQHDATASQRPDTFRYNLNLLINGNIEETLPPITADQIDSTPFTNNFTIDNYYHISVTAENCAGGSGSVNSKSFVLLGLTGKDGFTDISDSTGLQAKWVYPNLIEQPNGFEVDYLPKEYFTFYINNTLTQNISNISNFSLNLPYSFSFYLPPGYDRTNKNNVLVILFNDQTLADNISIIFKEIGDPTVIIILIVLSVFLLILLVAIVAIIIVFLGMYFYSKRSSKQ